MFAKPVAALLITAWYQNSEALVQCVIPANKCGRQESCQFSCWLQ